MSTTSEERPTRQERRKFLVQAGTVAAATLGAGYVSLAPPRWPLSLRDPDGERGKPRTPALQLPKGGFAIVPSPVLPYLGVAHGARVPAMVRGAIDAIGGIGRFVQRGD